MPLRFGGFSVYGLLNSLAVVFISLLQLLRRQVSRFVELADQHACMLAHLDRTSMQ